MPEVSGRALIHSLKETQRDLKAIAITGYAVEGDLDTLGIDVIQKPLELDMLAKKIRQKLDAD